MAKTSAGILAYRKKNGAHEFFLCHPGGPFYQNKDLSSWTIPKGEYDSGEEPLAAAKREFEEETGQKIEGDFLPLNPVKYKSGKIVTAWAVHANPDEKNISSNFFSLEWPPKSGKYIDVPEIDKCEWFSIEEARKKILPALRPLMEELFESLEKKNIG
jgi:predicted NUDIX family NTP pyrophosphohydrolase